MQNVCNSLRVGKAKVVVINLGETFQEFNLGADQVGEEDGVIWVSCVFR